MRWDGFGQLAEMGDMVDKGWTGMLGGLRL
jgi:hypothetical protein